MLKEKNIWWNVGDYFNQLGIRAVSLSHRKSFSLTAHHHHPPSFSHHHLPPRHHCYKVTTRPHLWRTACLEGETTTKRTRRTKPRTLGRFSLDGDDMVLHLRDSQVKAKLYIREEDNAVVDGHSKCLLPGLKVVVTVGEVVWKHSSHTTQLPVRPRVSGYTTRWGLCLWCRQRKVTGNHGWVEMKGKHLQK